MNVPALVWDISLGARYDLCARSNQALIVGWARAGLLLGWHAGFPCQSFSKARDRPNGPPRLRSVLHPEGLPELSRAGDRENVAVGNLLLRFCVRLANVSMLFGVPWTMENPRLSYAWQCGCVKGLLRRRCVFEHDFEYCTYGTRWRKSTKIITFGLDLWRLRDHRCTGRFCVVTGHKHEQLVGTNSAGIFKTKLAESYPRGLCVDLALSFSDELVAAKSVVLTNLLAAKPE